MCKAMNVAKYIVNAIPVDNLKLQKLLYYCQAVHLAKYDSVLFNDDIEAWDYGPVVRVVYNKYKNKTDILKSSPSNEIFTDNQRNAIDLTLAYYGNFTGGELINETHSESPWIDAYKKGRNTIITPESMKEYYKQIYSFKKVEKNVSF